MSRHILQRTPLLSSDLFSAHPHRLAFPINRVARRAIARQALPNAARCRGYSTQFESNQRRPTEEKESFRVRATRAWTSTPTKWYPIPIALGALVLVAVQYRKQSRTSGDAVEVTDDGSGQNVRLKSSGPWQVQVLGALPLRSLSQLWGYLNGLVLPVWFRPFGFKLYSKIFGCNLEEIEYDDLTHYQSLGEFFYRRLKEDSRVIDEDATLVSPADGRVLHFGEIEGQNVEQVKGMTYSLDALLGVEGQSVNKEIDHVHYKEGSRKGEVVDDEHFAQINDIDYSLSKLLGVSSKQPPSPDSDAESTTSRRSRYSIRRLWRRIRGKRQPSDRDVAVANGGPSDASHRETTSLAHDAYVAKSLGEAAIAEQVTDANDVAGPNGGVPKIKSGNKLFFMVVYLAPGDYHRFHSPAPWVVERRRHFTGDLFSVSPYIANRLKDLFVLNERIALLGRWRYGFFSMVPVGATNVGSIIINFDESLRTNTRTLTHPPHTFTEAVYARASAFLKGHPLAPGEEMGGFKLGSTIVMVFEAPDAFRFTVEAGEKVKVGQRMGVIEE